MRKFFVFSCVVAVALLSSVPAHAGPGKKGVKKDAAQVFQKRDRNKDGSLTLAELTGKGKKDAATVEKKFKHMDKNSDGKVTLAEMKAKGKKAKKSA